MEDEEDKDDEVEEDDEELVLEMYLHMVSTPAWSPAALVVVVELPYVCPTVPLMLVEVV